MRPPAPAAATPVAMLAAYLAASLPPLLLAPAPPAALVALQAALLAATAWALRARDPRAGWLPLLALPLCYAALPHVSAGLGRAAMHDHTVLRWEERWFGTSPVFTLSARWPSPALGELLHLGYLGYYALIYLPPAWLWWRGRRDAFAASVLAVWATFVCCYAVFAWWPVQGPWYQWPAPATIPDGAARRLVLALLSAGSSRGTAFPSSHVAVAVAQTVALSHAAPRLALPAAAATALLTAGAVYGGFHYGVDVAAGAALGGVVGLAGPRLLRAARRSDPGA